MNDVPLVQKNDINSINTSLIAVKKQLKQLTEAVGLIDVDTSVFVKKSEVVDAVEAGNMNPVTSNAVVPVDEVAVGNMHSVTSNAVASKFMYFKVRNVTKNIGNKTYFTIKEFFPDDTNDYILVMGHGVYHLSESNTPRLLIEGFGTHAVDRPLSNLICISNGTGTFTQNTNYTISFDIFAIKKEMFYERTS